MSSVLSRIRVGDKVFEREGADAFGAVREVSRTHRNLLVNVEGSGDFTLPVGAVRSAHDGKVIIDAAALAPYLREAIAHAHDAEDPSL
jgi:hypothetical protein